MTIKRIEHYNTQDIFNSFEKLHQYAMRCLDHAMTTGRKQKDEEHGAWEMIMKLLGEDVWNIIILTLRGRKGSKQNV